MKQKELWAKNYTENEYSEDMENDRGIAYLAFITGFDLAKKICGIQLGEWEGVNDNSFNFVGEGELE